MENTTNTLDLLLRMDPPKPEVAEIKINRLSKAAGGDVIFELKALGYSRVAELKEMNEAQEMPVLAILAGVTSPDLKNPALLEKYKAVTPAELLKVMLTPGEIEDLYRKIQQLSGYLTGTIEDVKKK